MNEFIKCNDYIFRKKDLTYISRDGNCIKIYLIINNEDYTLGESFNNSKEAIEECDSIFEQLQAVEKEDIKEKTEVKSKEDKITLTEFWESEKYLSIHCNTEEKANKLLQAFDKLDKRWSDGTSYLEDNEWDIHKEKICYSNSGYCGSYNYYKELDYTIYEFDDVDLDN